VTLCLVDGHRIATCRFAQIMARRKKRQVKSDGLSGNHQRDEKNHSKSDSTKLSDEDQPTSKNVEHENPIHEVGSLSDIGEMNNRLEALMNEERHESLLDEIITNFVSELELKQDLCQRLPPESFVKVNSSTEELDSQVEKKRKKRKPRDKCSLPTCNLFARHRCSRCLEVRFCSQECSNQHWVVHREQCILIRERKERDREEIMD
jgi:hypothetical protein